MSQRTILVLGIVLISVLFVSTIATIKWLESFNANSEFFVGVEFAYSDNISDLKDLVDKVKNYTNLFVIGAIEISFNQTVLNEACDYVVDSGLHLIVFFTDSKIYNYTTVDWMTEAQQKYGNMFLGVYRYDEPGGNQLDQSAFMLVENATDYSDAATKYVTRLGIIVDYYLNYTPRLFTADYGLYWFDYKAGYSAIYTEFGWNHSRQLHIGLCRGAAKAYDRDWGAIVTWEYTQAPYIESGKELYDDMVLAYRTGAKYVVVFDYPKIGQYGILAEDHFDALKDFWNYAHGNPHEYGIIQGEVAYILPQDYGFGFRNPEDKIWGLWGADTISLEIITELDSLIDSYHNKLDIIYDNGRQANNSHGYSKLIFWNRTVLVP